MSLINEALKRARVEAARLDAAAKGVPPAALPVYVPRRRRPWLAPIVGFLGGLAAVAVAVAAFWLARPPAPDTAAAASPPRAPAPAVAERSGGKAVAERSGGKASAPQRATAPPAESPGVDRPPPAAPPEATQPAGMAADVAVAVPPPPATPEPRRPKAARAVPSPSEPQPPAPFEEGRTYFVEAQPAGGARVKLDFIVWSESRPFAQLNGKQVSPGQTVDGYELLEVERERVRLERGGRTFWLRVR